MPSSSSIPTASSNITEPFLPSFDQLHSPRSSSTPIMPNYSDRAEGYQNGLAAVSLQSLELQQSTAQSSVTSGGHKPQLSLLAGTSALRGRLSGWDNFGPRTHHVDPKPIPTAIESSATQLVRSQGRDNGSRVIGRTYGAGSVILGLKGKWPEASGLKAELVRRSSTLSSSLNNLKLMSKFKGKGRARDLASEEPTSQSPSSVQPLSLPSPPFLAQTRRLSNDTYWDSNTLQLENADDGTTDSYSILSRASGSEEANTPRSPYYSQPFSTTTTTTTTMPVREGSTSLAPITVTTTAKRSSGRLLRPGLPTELGLERHDENGYTFPQRDGVLPPEVWLKTGRPVPTSTQDDLSLNLQTLAERRLSLNRINRRASVSVANMLTTPSSPSALSNLPNSSFIVDSSSDKQSQYSVQSSATAGDTSEYDDDNENGNDNANGDSGVLPLATTTMAFGRGPPPLQASPAGPSSFSSSRINTKVLSPPSATHENEDDGVPTPTLTRQDTPFTSGRQPDSRSNRSYRAARSRSHSRSVSHTSSNEAGSWEGRPEQPFLDRPPASEKDTQVAQWEDERQRMEVVISSQISGPAFITRYEPKQGWFGVWNRGDIDEVMDVLRDLRAPKAAF